MKTIITIVLILLAGFTLTSCDETNATEATIRGADFITAMN